MKDVERLTPTMDVSTFAEFVANAAKRVSKERKYPSIRYYDVQRSRKGDFQINTESLKNILKDDMEIDARAEVENRFSSSCKKLRSYAIQTKYDALRKQMKTLEELDTNFGPENKVERRLSTGGIRKIQADDTQRRKKRRKTYEYKQLY